MTRGFRDWLYRPRKLEAELTEMDTRLQELWAACTKMSANLGQIGGSGGGGGDAKDGTYATYSDYASLRDKKQQELDDAESEILAFLSRVEESDEAGRRDAELLRWRYAYRADWEFIHTRLFLCGFRCTALRTVYLWHTEALKRAEKIWEETYGNQGSGRSDWADLE